MMLSTASMVATTVFASGTYTVGTGQTYTTLNAAFAAINSGAISGDIVLQLAANSTETGADGDSSFPLNNSGNASGASYTSILIYPTVDNVVVQGNKNSTLKITLDGADNVTIDGRKRDASGNVLSQNVNLTFTGPSGALFTYSNAATSNTIKYCNLQGVSGSKEIIKINSDALGGSDNNIFEYNNIYGTTNNSVKQGIYAAGALGNVIENLIIRNNNFYDCMDYKNASTIIQVEPYASGFTISGNSFYNTLDYSGITQTGTYRVISLGSNNNGHIIENNYIGGSAPQCSGTMILNKSTASAINFDIISINKSVATETKIIVRNNTIKNIQIGSNATSGTIRGIVATGTYATDTEVNEINANFIAGIDILGSTNLTGLDIGPAGTGNGYFSVINNVISLITNGTGIIIGINEDSNSNNNKRYIYNNTVYIGGTVNSANNSIAYNYLRDNATPRRIKNNIFVNVRSNSGAGKNYAVWYNTTAAKADADYNIYYVSGTNSVLARYNNASDVTLLPILSGDDANSSVANPELTISSPTVLTDYRSTISQVTSGSASDYAVSKDIQGNTRTVTQKGAFFVPSIVPVASGTVNSGDLTLTPASQIEVAAGAELNLNGAPNVSKIIVAPTGKITMNGYGITAPNGVVLQSDATGTATLTGDNAVANATVQQYVTSGRQWWYLSSPVSTASSSVFSGDQIGKHVEDYLNDGNAETTAPYYTAPFATPENLTPGRGYVVKRASTSEATYSFTGGSLNTGDIAATVTRTGTTAAKRGFNLVGNPYPSYINWDAIHAETSNIRNAVWFRTDDSGMKFHTYGDGDGVPEVTSSQIAPMQAFWVKVDADGSNGTLTFKNTHRSHFTTGANPLKVKSADLRPRLRLVVSNGTSSDETLIVGKSYATNQLDSYDVEKMSAGSAAIPEIYSLVQNEEMVINSMKELTDGIVVSLGFRPGQAGTYSLQVSQFENIDATVVLVDTNADTRTELSSGKSYSFTSDAAATNSRFSIEFRAPGTVSSVTNPGTNAAVWVTDDNRIAVQAAGLTSADRISVYTMAGQQLLAQQATGNVTVLNHPLTAGVYVVKVNHLTQKVVVH